MDVIVIDEVLRENSELIYKKALVFDETLNRYYDIMQKVSEIGFISGDTHDALLEFVSCVEYCKNLVTTSGKNTRAQAKTCIGNLDSLDEDLY